jgi:hypothetical protein
LVGWVWWKLVGIAGGVGFAAALATVVVMCMTRPRDNREWSVALISTVMSSIGGGAFLIRYFGLQMWLDDWVGAVGLLGVVFTCGLPGWTLVRVMFNWFDASKAKTLPELVGEAREMAGGFVAGRPVDTPPPMMEDTQEQR